MTEPSVETADERIANLLRLMRIDVAEVKRQRDEWKTAASQLLVDLAAAQARIAEREAALDACMAGGRYVRAENARLRRALDAASMSHTSAGGINATAPREVVERKEVK